MTITFSSVIRQKGKSQNGCFKKTHFPSNFPKNEYFLPPDTHTHIRNVCSSENFACFVLLKRPFWVCVSGGTKCSFFGKFDVLCFLETPVLRFALLPYYWRFLLKMTDNCFLFLSWRFIIIRSSCPEVLCKKGALRNFTKFTRKHLCQSLSLRPATLLKKRLSHWCFPVNFAKFLRTTFLQNASGRLLLSRTI